ncbi:hypothetical protein KOW79_007774 [Hemibagrus wyckioides]|uniref:Uncharacterized protein n=1 Tax=Hemibagrus wyckioides TaxID=337641 RepID=A0A9D3SNB5_9TELE|nr:hypothetical protein KOW79_007774 [Hemibagrus wyckioides]
MCTEAEQEHGADGICAGHANGVLNFQGPALSLFAPRERSNGSESSVLAFGFARAPLSRLGYIDNYHVTEGSLLCPGTFDLSRSAAPV